jgi:hypothetical protein
MFPGRAHLSVLFMVVDSHHESSTNRLADIADNYHLILNMHNQPLPGGTRVMITISTEVGEETLAPTFAEKLFWSYSPII